MQLPLLPVSVAALNLKKQISMSAPLLSSQRRQIATPKILVYGQRTGGNISRSCHCHLLLDAWIERKTVAFDPTTIDVIVISRPRNQNQHSMADSWFRLFCRESESIHLYLFPLTFIEQPLYSKMKMTILTFKIRLHHTSEVRIFRDISPFQLTAIDLKAPRSIAVIVPRCLLLGLCVISI